MKTKEQLLRELAAIESRLSRFATTEYLGELPATEWRETVAFTLGAMLRLILDLQERVEALEQ